MVAQVENTLQNSYQALINYVDPDRGGVHPQGGYIAKSGNYYPPAPVISEQIVATKSPAIFKKSAFSWRSIYHPFVNTTYDPVGDGHIVAEVCFTPTPMRMYTDHRVMGQIVLPGVSHISLCAACASVGMEGLDCCACQYDDTKSEEYKEAKMANKSKVAKATKKVATKSKKAKKVASKSKKVASKAKKVAKKSNKASKKHLKK